MHDLQRSARSIQAQMGVMERLRHLHRDADGDVHGHQAAEAHARAPGVGDREALDVLHGDVPGAVGVAEIEDLRDAGMPQLGQQARLVLEHAQRAIVLREVPEEALDHHVAEETALTPEAADEDLRHPTRRDLA